MRMWLCKGYRDIEEDKDDDREEIIWWLRGMIGVKCGWKGQLKYERWTSREMVLGSKWYHGLDKMPLKRQSAVEVS